MIVDERKFFERHSRTGRLANIRGIVTFDHSAQAPYEQMDQVFVPVDMLKDDTSRRLMTQTIEDDFFGRKVEFATTEDRCRKYFNENPEEWTQENLLRIWVDEYNLIEDWMNDVVFDVEIESYNTDERQFENVEINSSIYGKAALFETLKEYEKQFPGIVFLMYEDDAARIDVKVIDE